MEILFESRSCVILYNFLSGIPNRKPFLLPANICPIVIATFEKARIPYVFIDVSLKTFEMDKSILLKKINERPNIFGGVLWLRSYGLNRSNKKLFQAIKKINKNIFIIDDCCLSIPNFSIEDDLQDLTLFSTGYSKYVDYGWGGYGFLKPEIKFYSNNKFIFNKNDLSKLNNSFQNCINEDKHFIYLDKNWLGGIKKCSFIKYKNMIIKDIPKIKKVKSKINFIYANSITAKAQLPGPYQNWRFNILVKNKKKLLNSIFSENLFASSHYYPLPKILNRELAVKSEKLHNHIINLFNDSRYNEKMAIKTASIVNNHIEKWGYESFD